MIWVDESDQNHTILLRVGSELVVRLKANRTTGYLWRRVSGKGEDLFLELPTPNHPMTDTVEPRRLGQGGFDSFYMLAQQPGEGVLVFEYLRPFEKAVTPARVVTFRVSVEQGPRSGAILP